jgi:hypothetical protein
VGLSLRSLCGLNEAVAQFVSHSWAWCGVELFFGKIVGQAFHVRIHFPGIYYFIAAGFPAAISHHFCDISSIIDNVVKISFANGLTNLFILYGAGIDCDFREERRSE